MVEFIAGLWIGGLIGAMAIVLVSVASDNDRHAV